jgi:hypothetical protein
MKFEKGKLFVVMCMDNVLGVCDKAHLDKFTEKAMKIAREKLGSPIGEVDCYVVELNKERKVF